MDFVSIIFLGFAPVIMFGSSNLKKHSTTKYYSVAGFLGKQSF